MVTALACSLVGQTHAVRIEHGSLAARLYGRADALEDYYCNYGLNPEYRARLERAGLRMSGVGVMGGTAVALATPGVPAGGASAKRALAM